MSQRGRGVGIGLLAAALASSAHGADTFYGHQPEFRPAYDLEWQQEDTLSFELGLRYAYSHGELSAGEHWTRDTSQAVEAHFRIDDWSTATYARGHVGYGAAIEGEYDDGATSGTFTGGRLAYARADLGYNLYQTDTATLSAFAGYDYANQEVFESGLDIHALRLGASATVNLHDTFDIYGEVAAVPYAWAHAYGDYGEGDGSLYGYSAEVLVGAEPAPNVLVRAGLRAQYLTGPLTFDASGQTVDVQSMRWGPLVELTYAF